MFAGPRGTAMTNIGAKRVSRGPSSLSSRPTRDLRAHVAAIDIINAVRVVRIEVRSRGESDEAPVTRYGSLISATVVGHRCKPADLRERSGIVAVRVAAIDIIGAVRVVRIEVRSRGESDEAS